MIPKSMLLMLTYGFVTAASPRTSSVLSPELQLLTKPPMMSTTTTAVPETNLMRATATAAVNPISTYTTTKNSQKTTVTTPAPSNIFSAADTFAAVSPLSNVDMNASNITNCSNGAEWHGADSFGGIIKSPRAINALCYIFFLPFVIWQGCLRNTLFRRNRKVLQSNTSISSLYYFLAMSFLMRAIWLFLEEANWCTLKLRDEVSHSLICPCFMVLRILNRLSMLFSFSAFSNIAIFWAEIMSQARRAAMAAQNGTNDNDGDDDDNNNNNDNYGGGNNVDAGGGSLLTGSDNNGQPVKDCCNPATLFMMLNVWVYIIEFVVLWVEAFGHYEDVTYGQIRDYNYICVSFFFLILTLAMLCIGRSMYNIMKNGVSKMIISKMSLIMITCTLCFTLRSIILSWQPLSKQKIPDKYWSILYPSFVYPVPELVPALVVLITMAPKKSKSLEDEEDEDEEQRNEETGNGGNCCCCCTVKSRQTSSWMSSSVEEEEEEEGNNSRLESLLAFDVSSSSLSSTDSINGGSSSLGKYREPQRSRGWF